MSHHSPAAKRPDSRDPAGGDPLGRAEASGSDAPARTDDATRGPESPRERQEHGNRGPEEEPGFGQGA